MRKGIDFEKEVGFGEGVIKKKIGMFKILKYLLTM